MKKQQLKNLIALSLYGGYCAEKGTVAIFGPRSKANSEHIKSISDSMEIPYIETRWNYRSQDIIGEHTTSVILFQGYTEHHIIIIIGSLTLNVNAKLLATFILMQIQYVLTFH